MEEQDQTACGHARVRDATTIRGRGLALVLEDGFTGTVEVSNTIRSGCGAGVVAAVEFADGRDESGTWKGLLAVIVRTENATELFRPGDVVAFFHKS